MKTLKDKNPSIIYELMTVSSLTKNPRFYLLSLQKNKDKDKICLINVDNGKPSEINCVSRELKLHDDLSSGAKAQILNGNPSTGFSIAIVENSDKGARLGIWDMNK